MTKWARVCAGVLACAIASTSASYAQVNIYGLVNEMARQAAEAQRRQHQIDEQRRAEKAIILEQRRRDAEIKAQQRHERDRREAEERADEQRRAAAEAEAQKQQKLVQEAAERRAEAAKLVPAARQLIDDATEFLKTNPPKALDIVEQVAGLNSSLGVPEPDKLQSQMQALVTTLRGQPGYGDFEQRRGEKKREEANLYLAELVKTAKQQQSFARYYVTNHPTASATMKLLPLIRQLSAALAAPELQQMRSLTSTAEVAIREAGLGDEFVKSKNLLAQDAGKDNVKQQGLLRRTTKNAFLIDGDAADFVLIYNSSPASPHVVKNIRGEFDFDRFEARACLYQSGFDRNEIYLLRSTLQSYRLKSAGIAIDQAECNRSELRSYDVIAVERGAFIRLKADSSLPLLSEIENGGFSQLRTVTHDQRAAARQAEDKARSEIKADVENGGRSGFGILIAKKDAGALCLVTSQRLRGHKLWIDQNVDRLSTETSFKSLNEKTTVDAAYEALQRAECGAIYASAADLKQVSGALSRERKDYSFASLWASDGDIEGLEKAAAAREAEELAEAEKRKQADEGARKIAALQRAEEATKRENREKQLRAQYGKTAAAKAAAIADQVRSVFASGQDWQSTPAFAQFPAAIVAYENLVQSRWELQTFNSEVEDYGTADWKGRKLETAFAKVTVRMRNRILGDYKDVCFVFGRMNDIEFGMVRDTIGTTCADGKRIGYWKKAHSFQSSWLAE